MAQETLNGLLQYVIQTLSPEDKQWFARQLVDDAFEKEQVKPYTWDEARERLATAREQFRQGQYMTHDEVMHSQIILYIADVWSTRQDPNYLKGRFEK